MISETAPWKFLDKKELRLRLKVNVSPKSNNRVC